MQPVVIRRSRTAVAMAVFVSGLTAVVIIGGLSLGLLTFFTAFPDDIQNLVALACAGGGWIALIRHFSLTKPALVITPPQSGGLDGCEQP